MTSPVNNRTDGGRSIDLHLAVYLRVQDVHHSDVVTGLDETARERGPDESRPASDEHGRCLMHLGESDQAFLDR